MLVETGRQPKADRIWSSRLSETLYIKHVLFSLERACATFANGLFCLPHDAMRKQKLHSQAIIIHGFVDTLKAIPLTEPQTRVNGINFNLSAIKSLECTSNNSREKLQLHRLGKYCNDNRSMH